jgi:hypothetical protein
MIGKPKNKLNITPMAPRPTQEQMTAELLASGQPIQPMQPQQPSPVDNLIGGLGQGAKGLLQGFGDFISAQKDTPEGRLLLNNMLAGVTVALGSDPAIGANIVQQGQEQFKLGLAKQQKESERQFELEKLGLKESQETKKAEKEAKKQITKLEDDYRKEYNTKKIVKDSKEIDSAISRMDNVWNKYQSNPNPNSKNALDQALVITFNKMLDPGSVVRESEFARTPQGQSFISRIQGASEKLAEGGVGLTDAERDEIIVVAKQLQEGQMMQLEKEKQFYRELAEQRGLNIENILGKNKTKVPLIPKGIKSITDSKKTTPVINLESGFSMEVLPDA